MFARLYVITVRAEQGAEAEAREAAGGGARRRAGAAAPGAHTHTPQPQATSHKHKPHTPTVNPHWTHVGVLSSYYLHGSKIETCQLRG